MENNATHKPQNNRQVFLRFMRIVAVTLVTLWLLVLMIASADTDDLWFSLMIVSAFYNYSHHRILAIFIYKGCQTSNQNR